MKMYDDYNRVLSTIRSKHEPFKSRPEYMGILEHVSQEFGEQYLRLLLNEVGMSIEHIVGFCKINDSFGSPVTYKVGDLPHPVSPTSLRYLYHASRVLNCSKGIDRFVEVGAGYGGLYLALTYLSSTPIREYHLVDLEQPINLQKLVLANHTNVVYHSASTHGANVPDNCFFISNYCFSEINPELQKLYIQHLVTRCSRGFLAWNTIPCYDIGKPTFVEQEKPLTFSGNYFVYF